MIEARAADACLRPGVLATCILSVLDGENEIDAAAGAFVLAETILMWRQTVSKK